MTPPNSRSSGAVVLGRTGGDPSDLAEIIDLVHLPRGTRPTPIAYLEYEEVGRCRHLDCEFYQSCLAFAARVRWQSFHCRQCSLSPNRLREGTPHPASTESDALASVIKLR